MENLILTTEQINTIFTALSVRRGELAVLLEKHPDAQENTKAHAIKELERLDDCINTIWDATH